MEVLLCDIGRCIAIKAVLKMNPKQKILLKHNLNKNGKGQQFLTHEIRRLSDPYVPFYKGPLKNTAVEKVNKIIYVQPYAKKNWYSNKGGRGKRGKMWCIRMWADRGGEIVTSVAKYCGGRRG